MALDTQSHRAFISCEGNQVLAVMNLDNYQVIATMPLAAGPDVVMFDPGLKRAYVACSSGVISIFQEDDPQHFRKLEDFPVQKKVHSIAIDPETHRVYAPEEQEDGKPVARMIVFEASQ
jgi:DNA-binding beta-propeller fold protein YncE